MTAKEMISSGHPFCYFIPLDGYYEAKGWRPSLVFQDVSGHYPNGGGDVEPWYWGHDYKAAVEIADKMNREGGLTKEQADAIVASSLGASLMEERTPA